MDAKQLVEVAVLRWRSGPVEAAEGACEGVLGAPAATLVGLPVHEALRVAREQLVELLLKPLTPEPRVEFARGRVAGESVWMRLTLAQDAGESVAAVMNMEKVLRGAPPLQIFGLSSSLSHEIRNPLSSVKMAVQTLARNTTLGERDKRRLTIANREVRTMERMLSLLSEYGRDTPPMLEAMPLRTLVQDAAAQVKLELEERKIQLQIHVEGDEAALPRVRADAGRLRPVLAQLLLNVAAGQAEGSDLAVRVRPSADGRACELSLTDSSAALPTDDRAKLFEPFASFLAREAGLSLAALHRVMKGLGGSVLVDGGPENGTVYTLRFPT